MDNDSPIYTEGTPKPLISRPSTAKPIVNVPISSPIPVKRVWTPQQPWRPIGVYRTFPLPMLPLPPFIARIKWVRPN